MKNVNKNRIDSHILDSEFKGIVHNSGILSVLLRESVDEFKNRDVEEIKKCLELGEDHITVIGRETEYTDPEEGNIVADSVFNVRLPDSDEKVAVIVNVEGQNDPSPGYPLGKRAEYYLARIVSSQKGREFTGTDYGNLRKVYSIWFILRPKAEDRNTVTRYSMVAENMSGPKNRHMDELDTFNIVMVNVGPYVEGLPDVSAFPAALFSPMDGVTRKEIVKDKFKIALDDSILRGLENMSTLDQDTYNHGYRDGTEKGIEIGTEKGIEIGTERTLKKTAVENLLFMVKERKLTLEEACTYIVIPEEYRSEILEEVRKNL